MDEIHLQVVCEWNYKHMNLIVMWQHLRPGKLHS